MNRENFRAYKLMNPVEYSFIDNFFEIIFKKKSLKWSSLYRNSLEARNIYEKFTELAVISTLLIIILKYIYQHRYS